MKFNCRYDSCRVRVRGKVSGKGLDSACDTLAGLDSCHIGAEVTDQPMGVAEPCAVSSEFTEQWTSFGEGLCELRTKGVGQNLVLCVPNSTIKPVGGATACRT